MTTETPTTQAKLASTGRFRPLFLCMLMLHLLYPHIERYSSGDLLLDVLLAAVLVAAIYAVSAQKHVSRLADCPWSCHSGNGYRQYGNGYKGGRIGRVALCGAFLCVYHCHRFCSRLISYRGHLGYPVRRRLRLHADGPYLGWSLHADRVVLPSFFLCQ